MCVLLFLLPFKYTQSRILANIQRKYCFCLVCTSLCTYVNYFFFFSDISSLCRTQIFTVQNLLAGLGPAFSSSGEYRLSKGFHCPFHGLCVGLVRSGVFGHLHCLPGLFHDYQRRVGRLQRHWRYQGNFCHEPKVIHTGCPVNWYSLSISIPDFSDCPIKKI